VIICYPPSNQNAHPDQLYAKLDNGVTNELILEISPAPSIDKQMIGKRHKRIEFLMGELMLSDPESLIVSYSSTL